ncbi:MAG: hypothetical protein V9F04_14365 [Dermatophilaceae bacterium]
MTLLSFLDASPTPFHAAANVAARLKAEGGFRVVSERDPFPTTAGRYAVVRDGALVAWVQGEHHTPTTPWRIIGAHTDSPTFKVKPHPDLSRAGWHLRRCRALRTSDFQFVARPRPVPRRPRHPPR